MESEGRGASGRPIRTAAALESVPNGSQFRCRASTQPGLGLEHAEGLGGPTSACNTVGPKYMAPRSGRDPGPFKRVVSPWTASSAGGNRGRGMLGAAVVAF